MTKHDCKSHRPLRRRNQGEEGFALVLALVLLTALTILGVSAITTSNLDLKITRNLRHLEQARYASMAGGEHARQLMLKGQIPDTTGVSYFGSDDIENPTDYYIDNDPGTTDIPDGEMLHIGNDNNGAYQVNVVWISCGGPPAGYSIDKYHSSFFDLRSQGFLVDDAGNHISNANVTTISTMRRVMSGPCYMR